MKKTTKFAFLSMLLIAAMLVLSMASAVAEEPVVNTVNFETPAELIGHDILAFQIFKCTLNAGQLENVEWGDGIDPTSFITQLNTNHTGTFTSTMTAAEVAAAMAEKGAAEDDDVHKQHILAAALASRKDDSDAVALDADGVTSLERGYYLIMDKTDVSDKNDAANKSLLTYTNDYTFQVKTDKPTVEKKVKENHKYATDAGYGAGYNDVADYCMGDDVPFRLYGTIPNMDNYETYKYIFHDTLSAGLTAPAAADIKVYLTSATEKGNPSDGTLLTQGTHYTATVNGQEITISFSDLKAVRKNLGLTSKYVVVEYSAVLNQDAKVGIPGNPNDVYLTFSNKPDQSGEGAPATGKTPIDRVIVFDYTVNLTKIDQTDNTKTLEGAEFVLSRSTGNAENPKRYVILNGANKVTGWADKKENATKITSDENGKFSIVGLDDGDYTLEEVKAPVGYVAVKKEVAMSVTATTVNGQAWNAPFTEGETYTKLTLNYDGTTIEGGVAAGQASGNVAAKVENRPVSALPETGSVGTTIFTFGGLAMMMAAAVVFALRRREEI